MDGFSLTGACTVLAILLLRALLFRRMPKRVFVLLWAGALGILLFPGLISSPLSVYRLLPRMEAAAAAAGSAASAAVPTAGKLWPVLRQAVTAAGLLGLGVFYLLGLLRLHQSSPARTPAVSDWLAAHPLLRPLQVRTGPVAAPLCGGILLPRIVLPEDMDLTDRAGLDCVLTHEYVHVCRFDPLLKLLSAAALCLRWFDPFVWIAFLMLGRDTEYACDEAVLDCGIPPKQYAAVLLRAALRRAELLPAAARLNAGRIERRVARVTGHRPHGPFGWACALLVSLSLLLCFGTAPKSVEKPAPDAGQSSFMGSPLRPACKPDKWAWNPAFPASDIAQRDP